MLDRRSFLRASAATSLGTFLPGSAHARGIDLDDIPKGERPTQHPEIAFLPPRGRVPLSFIIDDSTSLVNMAHYAMPQFAAAYPDRKDYQKPWRDWPREIPDQFVRKFGEWCRTQGVKGKYSIVPYPACVGWVDRFIPGWSKKELFDSLDLVRDFMSPDWDIHSEMISHTRVLDLKTGRPFPEISRHTMENSFPDKPVSVDHLTDYIAYSLQVLKNADLHCDGFTTPGGFGNLVKSELSLAAHQAVRAVYKTEIPHYFKYLHTDKNRSTDPHIEHVSGLKTSDPECTVNVIAGTGDWFGGWDGVSAGDIKKSADKFITEDGKSGRMVEMIDRNETAIMLCHWPGIYCNGEETGFTIFKKAVERINHHYGSRTRWMKLSEIARYYAAKELTASSLSPDKKTITLDAPFAAPNFTLRVTGTQPSDNFTRVPSLTHLKPNTYHRENNTLTLCFDLPKGRTRITV
ncbi:twin-arginine translocation signal domain-containing protein [Akkermansiaceae bacterium]|nr:twin-arginine translocation signal domain-containing protein [Akkermansiaceae bacterium]